MSPETACTLGSPTLLSAEAMEDVRGSAFTRSRREPGSKPKKATSGFEPLLPDNADGETKSPEPSSRDVPELNPFLAPILERVTGNERERSR